MLITGLPGSGKSYLARTKYSSLPRLDDPMHKDALDNFLKENDGKDIVITDPWLCHSGRRLAAATFLDVLGYDVEFIFFENNIDKCKRNLQYRNDGRVINNLEVFNYEIPEGTEVLTIWQPES